MGSSGSVYVSDGYCNHRVAEFHANGTHAGDFEGGLQTPHALALDECRSRLYVASRESKEIVLFDLATRKETGGDPATLPPCSGCRPCMYPDEL